jgi:hypothetical protein
MWKGVKGHPAPLGLSIDPVKSETIKGDDRGVMESTKEMNLSMPFQLLENPLFIQSIHITAGGGYFSNFPSFFQNFQVSHPSVSPFVRITTTGRTQNPTNSYK